MGPIEPDLCDASGDLNQIYFIAQFFMGITFLHYFDIFLHVMESPLGSRGGSAASAAHGYHSIHVRIHQAKERLYKRKRKEKCKPKVYSCLNVN